MHCLQLRSQLHAALPGFARSTALSLIQPRSRSFNRILAHSTAFSLIFFRRFSIFSIKNAISVFLCHFMLIFQPTASCIVVNHSRFPSFEPLFPASRLLCDASETLPKRFRELHRGFMGLTDVDACISPNREGARRG